MMNPYVRQVMTCFALYVCWEIFNLQLLCCRFIFSIIVGLKKIFRSCGSIVKNGILEKTFILRLH